MVGSTVLMHTPPISPLLYTFALLFSLGDGGLVELLSWTVQFDGRP